MIIENLPFAEYRKDRAINISLLKMIGKSPLHFQYEMGRERRQTDDMLIGSATHTLILEKKKFFDEYWVLPEISLATKEGKAMRAKGAEENPGKAMLREEWLSDMYGMRDSVWSNEFSRSLIEGATIEPSIFAEWDGVPVKCRPDALRKDLKLILDLKTCQDASPQGFSKTYFERGYYLQAAWYALLCKLNDIEIDTFVFVAVEKAPPYAMCNYNVSTDDLSLGTIECHRLLTLYKRQKDLSEWPSYSRNGSPIPLELSATHRVQVEKANGILR